jgi:hypothetical protein
MIDLYRRLHTYDKYRFPIAIICIVVGIALFLLRPDFVVVQFPEHGVSNSLDAGIIDLGERIDLCAPLTESDGYVLISGVIQMDSLADPQGFFQSADNEDGYFLEYDPGENQLVRLGIRLADGTTTRVKVDTLQTVGDFQFVLLIGGDGSVRVSTGGADETTLVGELAPICTNWKIGSANGNPDFESGLALEISSGMNKQVADELLSKYVSAYSDSLPSTLYKWPLYAGVLLLVIGNPWAWRKR